MPVYNTTFADRKTGRERPVSVDAKNLSEATSKLAEQALKAGAYCGQINQEPARMAMPTPNPVAPTSRLFTHPRQTIAAGVALGVAYIGAVLLLALLAVRLVVWLG